MRTRGLAAYAVSLSAIFLPACSTALTSATEPSHAGFTDPAYAASKPIGRYIKHVVIIVQENRSFDNIFAGYPGADAPTYGYKHDGTKVALQAIKYLPHANLNHTFGASVRDYDNGKMDDFDEQDRQNPLFPYSYLERKVVAPYWAMAQQYTLADHMFPTEHGESFTAHLDLIAGTTNISPTVAIANLPTGQPWGCDSPQGTTTWTVNQNRVVQNNGPFPCFTQFQTMADTLDSAGVSWKYYAPYVTVNGGGLWSEFDAINNVRYGKDWANVISPENNILKDAMNDQLASVSWVVPHGTDSDHPSWSSDTGPSWVAAIVNTIGKSPLWASTAVIVLWDDFGGWYDDVPPPQLDFVGLGIRVPCIIISPYAKAGYVSHTQYEFGSVLRFTEGAFKLKSLGYSDARAKSIYDAFDFNQHPISFTKIPAKYPTSYFLQHRPSQFPPDDY